MFQSDFLNAVREVYQSVYETVEISGKPELRANATAKVRVCYRVTFSMLSERCTRVSETVDISGKPELRANATAKVIVCYRLTFSTLSERCTRVPMKLLTFQASQS